MELPGRGQRVEWFQHHKASPISSDVILTEVLDDSQPTAEQELGDADRQSGLELELDAHQVVFIQVVQLAAARVPHWLFAASSGDFSLTTFFSRCWKNVDLPPARFIRAIRNPVPVRREMGARLIERAVQEWRGRALLFRLEPDVGSGLGVKLVKCQ